MFITFEGPEGCGKSTHAKRLKSYFEGLGRPTLLTIEPGGTQVGKQIRTLLLNPDSVLDETTEIYLFAADRAEHVNKVIQPALDEGKIVIGDRFTDSTLAYQVGGRGLSEDFVRYVNLTSSKGLQPDLTILLDLSPEEGLRRATKHSIADRFEQQQIAFHQRVRQFYQLLAREQPARVKMIDTEAKAIDEVQAIIRRLVDEKFGN